MAPLRIFPRVPQNAESNYSTVIDTDIVISQLFQSRCEHCFFYLNVENEFAATHFTGLLDIVYQIICHEKFSRSAFRLVVFLITTSIYLIVSIINVKMLKHVDR
jgi:hypothetical protein